MPEYSPIAKSVGRIVSGLFILTTGEGERATGMLASFVQQAGFEPPTVTVALKKGRAILDQLRDSKKFCVSILHDGSIGLLAHFAKGFEPGQPAFEGVATGTGSNGVPYLAEAHAHIECELIGEADWSDHIVFCGVVLDGDRIDDDQPLTHVRKDGLNY